MTVLRVFDQVLECWWMSLKWRLHHKCKLLAFLMSRATRRCRGPVIQIHCTIGCFNVTFLVIYAYGVPIVRLLFFVSCRDNINLMSLIYVFLFRKLLMNLFLHGISVSSNTMCMSNTALTTHYSKCFLSVVICGCRVAYPWLSLCVPRSLTPCGPE